MLLYSSSRAIYIIYSASYYINEVVINVVKPSIFDILNLNIFMNNIIYFDMKNRKGQFR